MSTQDGYDWPTPHPVAPIGWTLDGQRVVMSQASHRELARHHERFDAQMDAALACQCEFLTDFRATLRERERERDTRDRCLQQMTEQVLTAREKWPFAPTHSVCSRNPGRVVQHKVPADVPADAVRAWLARDLGWSE